MSSSPNLCPSLLSVSPFRPSSLIATPNNSADASFGLEGISYFNTVLKYYYIALLICCFLLALGNRPAGAQTWYMVIIISFALITVYMLVSHYSQKPVSGRKS